MDRIAKRFSIEYGGFLRGFLLGFLCPGRGRDGWARPPEAIRYASGRRGLISIPWKVFWVQREGDRK